MENPKAKDLLSGRDLIGFARRPGSGDQLVHRASSAKVTIKPGFKEFVEPESAGDAQPRPDPTG